MATRKRPRPKHPPKAVEFHFDEKMPRRPAARRSRLLRGETAAANRLVVEELLCRHHGASDAAFRRLSAAARKVLFRIVTDPADRDHIYRRDAVSALAAIGSRDAVMLLSALATDEKEDAVIVGRALNGLAKLGGDVAAQIIERSMDHRDAYVRAAALKAMLRLENSARVPALMRVVETHPSPILQAQARKLLAKLGAAVKGSRSVVTRNKGVLVRESER